ncbi:MAG: ABC transporter substrate-binding protein, partial [Candidatus Binatia bacterium]
MRKSLAVLLLLGGLASVAEAGSVEELLAEINRLPAAARQKRLEEGARREGAFKFYGVPNAELLGGYTAGFMKRYPFIKAEFWRGSGNKLVFRTLTEHRTGRLDADAVLVGTENVIALKKAGIYVRYHSPESQFYPKYFYDPDGFWHADTLGIATMAYNTQLVKKEQAPRGYEELFDPKWKGNLSIDLEPERALMGWLVAWGENKTRAFVEGLIKNGVLVRRGHTLQAQLLCAGEFKVAVEV